MGGRWGQEVVTGAICDSCVFGSDDGLGGGVIFSVPGLRGLSSKYIRKGEMAQLCNQEECRRDIVANVSGSSIVFTDSLEMTADFCGEEGCSLNSADAVLRCHVPNGQGVKTLSIGVEHLHDHTTFFYRPPVILESWLESGNPTARTDGLLSEFSGEPEILAIHGENLGTDGLVNALDHVIVEIGGVHVLNSGVKKEFGHFERDDLVVLEHTHNLVRMHLPPSTGGIFPTTDLSIKLLMPDLGVHAERRRMLREEWSKGVREMVDDMADRSGVRGRRRLAQTGQERKQAWVAEFTGLETDKELHPGKRPQHLDLDDDGFVTQSEIVRVYGNLSNVKDQETFTRMKPKFKWFNSLLGTSLVDFISEHDLDGDAKMNENEWLWAGGFISDAQAMEIAGAAIADATDSNNDGFIVEEELKAWHMKHQNVFKLSDWDDHKDHRKYPGPRDALVKEGGHDTSVMVGSMDTDMRWNMNHSTFDDVLRIADDNGDSLLSVEEMAKYMQPPTGKTGRFVFVDCKSEASLSYQHPIFYSIRNFHTARPGNDWEVHRPDWKRVDAGSSDGFYAELHGANFGEGCGGDCEGMILDDEVHDRIGTIRFRSVSYDWSGLPQYEVKEIGWSLGLDGNLLFKEADEGYWPMCTCAMIHGKAGFNQEGKPCAEDFAETRCPPIKSWNQTHIVFFVRKGLGSGLPMNVQVGQQQSCRLPKVGQCENGIEWCSTDNDCGGDRKCENWKIDSTADLAWCPDKKYQIGGKCGGLEWASIDPDIEGKQEEHCAGDVPGPNCFCHYSYGFTDPSTGQAVPGLASPERVTVNYDAPVIDKITPDKLRGHLMTSSATGEKDAPKNESVGMPFNIGDPGEEIIISGTDFGSPESMPRIVFFDERCPGANLDDMDMANDIPPGQCECLNARVVKPEVDAGAGPGDKTLDPFITCISPIMTVGAKGLDPSGKSGGFSSRSGPGTLKIKLLVGGQEALINPEVKPSTRLNLVRTECFRKYYGQEGEVCLEQPKTETKTQPLPGSECTGGLGFAAEPIPTRGWFSVPLVRDNNLFEQTSNWPPIEPELQMMSDELRRRRRALRAIQRVGRRVRLAQEASSSKVVYEGDFGRRLEEEGLSLSGLKERAGVKDPVVNTDDKPAFVNPYDEGLQSKAEGAYAALTPTSDGDAISMSDIQRGCSQGLPPDEEKLCWINLFNQYENKTFYWPRRFEAVEDDRIKNEEYSSFCNNTLKPNGTVPESQMPPDAFLIGRDHKTCYHMSELEDGSLGLPVKCDGRDDPNKLCCLSRWCAPGQGVSFIEKNREEKTGCVVPLEFGDPRFYQHGDAKITLQNGNVARFCIGSTFGKYVWEEDRTPNGRLPSRVEVQDVGVNVLLDGVEGRENKCELDRWHREVCPYVVPCEPAEACVGDNVCAPAYSGKKCSKCAANHFRMDGLCVACPSDSLMGIIMFGVAGLIAAAVFLVIQKLKLNIGVVSLGIDYFQVLALFGAAKVAWPENLKTLLNYASVTSLNLDMAAPDCVGGGLSPAQKWFVTMLSPVFVGILLTVSAQCSAMRVHAKARTVESKRKNAKPGDVVPPKYDKQHHLDKASGGAMANFLSFMILVYLNITKKTFDVFKCEPEDPPDDPINPTRLMSMMPSQICFAPGNWDTGLHVKLLPWAMAFAVTYSFAFPVYVVFKTVLNKKVIFEDQLLFAQERGESPYSNPQYSFRLRYSKLYKNFKPDQSYWVVVTLMRKLGICFTALFFERNGTFQLAVAMLVLFASFVAHVLNRPYLDFKEKASIVRYAAERDKERGRKMNRKLAAFGQSAEVKDAEKRIAQEEANQLQVASALQKSSKYFVSYNDLEGTLMCCGIFVALSGCIFGTSYFENPFFSYQGVILEWLNILVVTLSIGYFLWALGAELTGIRKYRHAKNRAKWTGFKSNVVLNKKMLVGQGIAGSAKAVSRTAVLPTPLPTPPVEKKNSSVDAPEKESAADAESGVQDGKRLAAWGKKGIAKSDEPRTAEEAVPSNEQSSVKEGEDAKQSSEAKVDASVVPTPPAPLPVVADASASGSNKVKLPPIDTKKLDTKKPEEKEEAQKE